MNASCCFHYARFLPTDDDDDDCIHPQRSQFVEYLVAALLDAEYALCGRVCRNMRALREADPQRL